MQNTYAIGDIHGCSQSLKCLLEQMPVQSGDRVVFLGDYIHRGPDSRGVIDTILSLPDRGIETICLRGNHEEFFLRMLRNPALLDRWTNFGGESLLASYGLDSPWKIPTAHLDFIRNTEYFFQTDEYIFVHGGPNFTAVNPLSNPDVLLWIRNWYHDISYSWLGNRIIIHGHTPSPLSQIKNQYENLDTLQYLNLDNGCVYGLPQYEPREDQGHLLGFGCNDRSLYIQENAEVPSETGSPA